MLLRLPAPSPPRSGRRHPETCGSMVHSKVALTPPLAHFPSDTLPIQQRLMVRAEFLNGFFSEFEQFSAKLCPWHKRLSLCRRRRRQGAGGRVDGLCGKFQRGLYRVAAEFRVCRKNPVYLATGGEFFQNLLDCDMSPGNHGSASRIGGDKMIMHTSA